MVTSRMPLLRGIVICVFVFGLCGGLTFQADTAYARVSLSNLQDQINALQQQVDGIQADKACFADGNLHIASIVDAGGDVVEWIAGRCGDGHLDAACEACDDGNTEDGDGCHGDCTLGICGDGIVDPGEQCDDGNASNDDDCNNECRENRKIVFVTSATYTGNLGGVAGADAKCQAAANDAGLPGTYLAWISTATVSPATRFIRSQSPYIRSDGVVIAADWEDLTDGYLIHSVNVNEYGGAVGGYRFAWTSTYSTGYRCTPYGAWDCQSWTTGSSSLAGYVGEIDSTNPNWAYSDGFAYCSTPFHLYCFQQ